MIDEKTVYRAFGKSVAAHRRAHNMTQAQLGEAVGLARTSIVHIEKGNQKVFLHHVLAISEALGLPSAHEIVPSRAMHDEAEPTRVKISGDKDLSELQRRLVTSAYGLTSTKRDRIG